MTDHTQLIAELRLWCECWHTPTGRLIRCVRCSAAEALAAAEERTDNAERDAQHFHDMWTDGAPCGRNGCRYESHY